jgi:hypothetical protein
MGRIKTCNSQSPKRATDIVLCKTVDYFLWSQCEKQNIPFLPPFHGYVFIICYLPFCVPISCRSQSQAGYRRATVGESLLAKGRLPSICKRKQYYPLYVIL